MKTTLLSAEGDPISVVHQPADPRDMAIGVIEQEGGARHLPIVIDLTRGRYVRDIMADREFWWNEAERRAWIYHSDLRSWTAHSRSEIVQWDPLNDYPLSWSPVQVKPL